MPALVKQRSKGVVVAQSVSSIYTALAGLESVEISGEKILTDDTVTLDGPRTQTKDATGYVAAPSIKLSGLYDPGHATYTNLANLVTTLNSVPSSVPVNFKITYTDTVPTAAIYAVVSVQIDKKAEPGKMLRATISLETSGDPT